MKVVNLTPHEVTVYDDDDVVIKTYPSEGLARASHVNTPVDNVDGGVGGQYLLRGGHWSARAGRRSGVHRERYHVERR